MNNRRVYHGRGKILGGSSSINGMIFQRGNPMEYQKWSNDPGMEKWLSVHATGAAIDIGYEDRKVGVAMWDWFIKYTKELGIEEIHDYAFDANPKDKNKGYGRGFRCSRGENAAGVKIFSESDNAGSFGGKWLHIELSPEMAKDAVKFEAAWRALPKPGA